MPVIEVCDECYAKAGTCNCYDWDYEQEKIKRGDKVSEITTGEVGIIVDIQYVHNRYQFEHLSGWRYTIKNLFKI